MFKNKRILVTGGTGFIGSNLVRRLISEGANVFILAREKSNFSRINDVLEGVRIRISDLSDASRLKKIVQEIKPDGIFHLGAITIMSGVMVEPEKVMQINFSGTKNLVEALSQTNYDFFINTGSFSEIESQDDYSKSKLLSTEFSSDYAKKHGKSIVTLRLFTPYGPFIQKGRLIYNVLTNAMKGEDIKMTSPNIARDFIFVDDIVDLYFESARMAGGNKGEIFNAGTGVKTTLKEVADIALKITGSKSRVLWGVLPAVSYDSDKIQADMTRTFSKLGWKPKIDFETGLKKTYKWLRENISFYQ